MNYNKHTQTHEFLNYLASNSFAPLILHTTGITSYSNTLIDNIFPNVTDPDIISDNLTAGISDHLPQFAMILGWIILQYLLKIDEQYADNSTKIYLDKINMSLTLAPLRINKFKFKFKSKS